MNQEPGPARSRQRLPGRLSPAQLLCGHQALVLVELPAMGNRIGQNAVHGIQVNGFQYVIQGPQMHGCPGIFEVIISADDEKHDVWI